MEAAAEADEEASRGDGAGNLHYNRRRRRRQRRRRPSMAASSETTTDGSFRFTDSDSDQSWASAAGGPYEECRFSAAAERLRHSWGNAFSVPGGLSDDEIDLESGELELKIVGKEEEDEEDETRDCRICRLSLSGSGGIGGDGELEPSSGDAIQLGCACRGDLGTAHKQCAETWFKMRGNTTCEICGETAVNVAGELTTEENETGGEASLTAPPVIPETQRFWHGRRIMNFLLASMILAFVISWLFHFNILP